MFQISRVALPFLLSSCFLLASCASSLYQKGINRIQDDEYTQAIAYLLDAEKESPDDYKIKRELGVAYYKSESYKEALEKLEEARSLEPEDGKTIFYLGLTHESLSQIESALEAYRNFTTVTKSKKFKKEISKRIKQLNAEMITSAVSQSIARENAIDISSIPNNTVAVLSFDNLSSDDELAPLSKGLAQMVITDLAKSEQLTVVERQKLQTLLKELELGTSGKVDTETAPRVGKLLGARRLVKGGFTSLADANLRIDASLAEIASTEVSAVDEVEGDINSLFKMQKTLVFNVFDEMGITLTKEERESIEKIPTESLLAFLAYSRGLDYEDRGMYSEAKAEYSKAVELDPDFTIAELSLDEIEIAEAAAKDPIVGAENLEEQFETDITGPAESLKSSRLLTTIMAAQTGQMPQGDNDTREPVQETIANTQIQIVVPLPSTF